MPEKKPARKQHHHHEHDGNVLHIAFDTPLHIHDSEDVRRAVERIDQTRLALGRSTRRLKRALGVPVFYQTKENAAMSNPSLDAAIDELVAEVAESTTIQQSAVVYIKGVPALIQAAIDAAIADGVTPEQLVRITEAKDALSAKGDELIAALQPPLTGKKK